jgi:hypothetical protein
MPHVLASLVNLNHPGRYVHWGFIQMSLANLLVIALMLVVFILAIVLPFPHSSAVPGARTEQPGTGVVDEHPEVRTEQ